MATPSAINDKDEDWLQFRKQVVPGALAILVISYLLLFITVFARSHLMRAVDWLVILLLPPLGCGFCCLVLLSLTLRNRTLGLMACVLAHVAFAVGFGLMFDWAYK